MTKSFLVGHILQIPVKVHWSLLALFALLGLGFVSMATTEPRAAALLMLVYVGIFLTILLHELGHAVVAQRFGSDVVDIILAPIGGIARIRRMPEKAREEFLVAIAGPAVNVVLLFIIAGYIGSFEPIFAFVSDVWNAYFDPGARPREIVTLNEFNEAIAILGGVNLVIAVFNMLPGFPMDGGRVLRSLLTPSMGYVHATTTAVLIGRIVALAFAVWGVILLIEYGMLAGMILSIIALFLWITGAAEHFAVKRRELVRGLTVQDAIAPDVPVLGPSVPYHEAQALMAARGAIGLPVVDELGYLVGWLDHHPLQPGQMYPHGYTVGESMRPRVKWVSPEDPLDRTVQAIEEVGVPAVPVTDPTGRYFGTLTLPHLQAVLLERFQHGNAAAPTR